jgi:hypothetical protein
MPGSLPVDWSFAFKTGRGAHADCAEDNVEAALNRYTS